MHRKGVEGGREWLGNRHKDSTCIEKGWKEEKSMEGTVEPSQVEKTITPV